MTVSMMKNIAAVFLKIKVGNVLRISFLNLCLKYAYKRYVYNKTACSTELPKIVKYYCKSK